MLNNRIITLFFLPTLIMHAHAGQQGPSANIWKAMKTGNVEYIRAVIRNLSDPVERITFQFETKHKKNGNTPLHAAIKRGQLAIVQLFTESRLFVTIPNGTGKTPLHLAAEHGYITIARDLLAQGAEPNGKDSIGDTALHTAANSGHADVVQLLLDAGAQINTPSNDGMGALHIAAKYGDTEIIQLLLTRQANPHATDKDGETPLHNAARGGHVDAARLLIKHGASVNTATKDGDTPLHRAADNGHIDAARLLIEHGTLVNVADNDGWTPLHMAAANGHVKVIRLLIEHDARVNSATKNASTPLHLTAFDGHVEVIRLLIKHGAYVNSANNNGETPLHLAAANGGYVTAAHLLLDAGANLLAQSNPQSGNWTPLILAVKTGKALLTQFLIRQGRARGYNLDILLGQDSVCGENASSLALHLAIERALSLNENEEGIESNQKNSIQRGENLILCLLEAGGNPDNQHNGVGILHLAAEYGKGKMARMLLDHGANPNSEDTESDGNSIYLASQNNHRNMMRLLVARGAKPIQTVPVNPQETQFQTELAQIGHNRRQMFRQILRSKGLPFDLIRYMARFAPFDIAR